MKKKITKPPVAAKPANATKLTKRSKPVSFDATVVSELEKKIMDYFNATPILEK